jgi:hypothetical protein
VALQTFTAGQVLTAAQVNALQTNDFNQTVTTKTANYTFVVGDRGTRVVGNGTSITFTVDNTIFSAGDTIKLHNINSTALTIAAGAGVTINAAAGLTMVQYQEATLFATSASSFILFESTAATTTQGLTLINTTSFSAVSSVSLTASTFTSTYKHYRINVNYASSASDFGNIRLRASGSDNTTSNYNKALIQAAFAGGTPQNDNAANATTFRMLYNNSADTQRLTLDVMSPQESTYTTIYKQGDRPDYGGEYMIGLFKATTSFDSLTIYPSSGTITGSYSVYGYNV